MIKLSSFSCYYVFVVQSYNAVVVSNETFPFDNGKFFIILRVVLLESYGQDSMTKKCA